VRDKHKTNEIIRKGGVPFPVRLQEKGSNHMGEEAVDGSKLGTKLIMFVAIIGLALAAFLLGKSLVNTGVDQMETSVKSISDSQFSDYDSKVVRGRAVKNAFSTFGNSEYALVVCTTEMASDSSWVNKATYGTQKLSAALKDANGQTIEIENSGMQNSSGKSVEKVVALNYNAQLDMTSDGTSSKALSLNNGYAEFNGTFATDDGGNVKYYLYQVNLSKKGQPEYVADSSSFNACLIKNSSGDILGIIFLQRKLN
jgi:hypothetical protein